ncbi:MAG: ATP-binding protein [Verrucomicrobiae bacterium]
MQRLKLPIGIQTLAKIREEGYYYVDKSAFALDLIEKGGYYFLSRPRRFGKSLFLDTLKELFEGNQKLFAGLHAETRWDWSRKHPVIRISFSDGVLRDRAELDARIWNTMEANAERLGIALPRKGNDISWTFSELIAKAHKTTGQRAVVLIDEYDKPILDNIEKPEAAIEMREGLKNLYSALKGADADLRFVFLTGVSKFSKVSLFSGLNNLDDITVDPRYSAICGYTEADVDAVFAPELEGLDREKIRAWYNGYNWLGESVYNPFDLLLLFDKRQFRPYWYETGTPTFLLKLLRERPTFLPELSNLQTDAALLSTFDVGNIPTEALLFQAGYLTIASQEERFECFEYRLRYPNREVYQSLNNSFLLDWTPDSHAGVLAKSRLGDLLLANDLAGMGAHLKAFYDSIPHQWYANNTIAQYEGYYASVFYAFFASLGLDITVEESSNAGRLDMAMRFAGRVYLFEFKLVADKPDGSALAQIRERGYADRHRASGEAIHLIGVEFSRRSRTIVAWDLSGE